jgi:hypothetical protein
MEMLQSGDSSTILLWIIAVTLSMLLLVLAGIVLSGRAFTQLVELIRFLGSQAVAQRRADQRQPTTSLAEPESDTPSSLPEDTPTTWESPKSG